MNKKRYKLIFGKFGAYFLDTFEKRNLELLEVLDIMNKTHKNSELVSIGNDILEVKLLLKKKHQNI
jgi:hypothetical protein